MESTRLATTEGPNKSKALSLAPENAAGGVGNDNRKRGPHYEEALRIAIDIFVKMAPNALGKAAYKYDPRGHFYNAATEHKKYYPRKGDIEVLQEYSESVSNRARDIRRLVVIGPGPAEAFRGKEGVLIEKIASVNEVVTIDLAEHFNSQAKKVVSDYSKQLGRLISHRSITMDYRQAAEKFPNQDDVDTLVVCSGGLITNTETGDHNAFPAKEFKADMAMLAKLAGKNGQVLVTYDSNENEETLLSAYKTKAFSDLYLNVIDVIGQTCPEFSDLNRSNFEVVSRWNKKSQAVEHLLRVKKPMSFEVSENGNSMKATHHINLNRGQEIHIISSYKPDVKFVSSLVSETGLQTSIVTERDTGSTLHLMSVTPK